MWISIFKNKNLFSTLKNNLETGHHPKLQWVLSPSYSFRFDVHLNDYLVFSIYISL